jgi:hypothetical protein
MSSRETETTKETEKTMDAITVFQLALVALGHTFTRAVDGSYDVEANPARANEFGGISEADYAVAEDAVRRAYDAGERSARKLGVVFHPDCDQLLGNNDASPRPGQYGVY